jgi:hypothetical protein
MNGEMPAPVYLSFTTFRSAVQSLRTHGLPDRLDRTAWQSRSGGEQSQIISAFKFLGLIDETERTQPNLRKLVDAAENSKEEKQILGELLRSRYGKVLALNLKTVTQGALAEAIGSYGATGATRDRAVRFFIKTATHCGIELSSRLTSHLRSRSESAPNAEDNGGGSPPVAPGRTRRRRRQSNTEVSEQQNEKPSGNAVKTITLRNISSQLTLSGTFNPFELDGDERKLVYDIIDVMKQYEQKTRTASE